MHESPWFFQDEPTGRVRFSIGLLGRITVEMEVERVTRQFDLVRKQGRHWKAVSRFQAAELVRFGPMVAESRTEVPHGPQ